MRILPTAGRTIRTFRRPPHPASRPHAGSKIRNRNGEVKNVNPMKPASTRFSSEKKETVHIRADGSLGSRRVGPGSPWRRIGRPSL